MPHTYFIWEKSEIYTNYGLSEAWMISKSFEAMRRFDYNLKFPGLLGARSYYDSPVDISPMENPSSKVMYIVTRQSPAQSPRAALFNPLHKFCYPSGEIVEARNVRPQMVLAALNSETLVVDVKEMDYKNSNWYVLTTSAESPNIFINNLVSFPTKVEEVLDLETKLNGLEVQRMEYSGTEEEKPISLADLRKDMQNLETPYIVKVPAI